MNGVRLPTYITAQLALSMIRGYIEVYAQFDMLCGLHQFAAGTARDPVQVFPAGFLYIEDKGYHISHSSPWDRRSRYTPLYCGCP